jgi:hypothetical protein
MAFDLLTQQVGVRGSVGSDIKISWATSESYKQLPPEIFIVVFVCFNWLIFLRQGLSM